MKIFFNPIKIFLPVAYVLLLLFFAAASQASYNIEIGLPNLPAGASVSDPGVYVKYLFIFGMSLAGFLAVGAIAIGGIQYMIAGASSVTSTQKAKDLIIGALSGIALLLCSWILLATIDPALTKLSPRIDPIGNIAAPESPATRNCNPPCGAGSFCRASDFTCQPIPAGTSPENAECITPGQCTELKCAPSGRGKCTAVRNLPLVWNPNTCTCVKP